MLIKRIVKHFDSKTVYLETHYESEKPIDVPYGAGSFHDLCKGFTQNVEKDKAILHSLFNKSNLAKIELELGKNELYILVLRMNSELSDIYTNPESISIDLYPGGNYDHYIYTFYNNTDTSNITITAKMVDMDKSQFNKLRSHLDDINFRQYILKKSLSKSRGKDLIPPAQGSIKENLTVAEVADYLNKKVGTIYNLVYKNDIPFHKPGGRILLFKKSEIDNWIQREKSFIKK